MYIYCMYCKDLSKIFFLYLYVIYCTYFSFTKHQSNTTRIVRYKINLINDKQVHSVADPEPSEGVKNCDNMVRTYI